MALHSIAQPIPVRSIGNAWDTLARLAGSPSQSLGSGEEEALDDLISGPFSREQLTATLIANGIPVDEDTILLADTFARLGAPLDESSLHSARAILARMPNVKPAGIALANLLGVGRSSVAMQALSQFLEGLPNGEEAGKVASMLSVAVGPDISKSELAATLRTMISGLTRSTENRLLNSLPLGNDLRTSLLTLAAALDGRRGVDLPVAMSAHLQAQQLMNQVSMARFDPPVPLYFAFYVIEPNGQRVPAEFQVWSRPDDDTRPRDPDSVDALHATVRVTPSSLGLIQAVLSGTLGGHMRCRLSAERLQTYRLMRREAPNLATALTAAGWDVRQMDVAHTSDFPPLWYGGAALSQPRTRIDRRA